MTATKVSLGYKRKFIRSLLFITPLVIGYIVIGLADKAGLISHENESDIWILFVALPFFLLAFYGVLASFVYGVAYAFYSLKKK